MTVINTLNGPDIFFRIFAITQDGLPLIGFGIDGVLDITGHFGYIIGIIKLNGGGFLLLGFNTNQFVLSKHFNDGSLDGGMGFESLIGAILHIDKITEKLIEGKVFVNVETEHEIIGEIDEDEALFLN